jgi:hypothetical protein
VGGQINGNAQFFDQVTISAPGLAGSIGYLLPSFAVTGTTQGPANAFLGVFVDANYQVQYFTGSSGAIFNPLPFTFGQPFSLEIDFGAVVYYSTGGPLSAVSDFSHTAAMNGFGVFQDSSATIPVSSPTFSSAAGVTYSVNGIVPEPTSFSLMGIALLSLALICRWRSKTSS